MWRFVKVMPRTAPAELKPESDSIVRWHDVAGVEEAKAELAEIIEFLRDPARFERLGARVPRGVLLHGPPGTGKTLLAKAVAAESGAAFFSQPASAFVEMFAGLGASRIRKLFETARKHAPAIVFIDELDAVGAARQSAGGFNREQDQTLNQLLVELDGFRRSDVVIMASTNRLDTLDAALLRPGRFDRQVYVSPPDLLAREQILNVHVRNKPIDADRRPHEHRARDRGPRRAPTSRTSATRPPSARPAPAAPASRPSTSTTRSSASSPASRRTAPCPRTRSG